LLKANTDGLSQLLLGEAQETATAAEPLADMEVNGVSHECAPLFMTVSPMGPPYAQLESTSYATFYRRELRRGKLLLSMRGARQASFAPFRRRGVW
jgi:hypothetical protein